MQSKSRVDGGEGKGAFKAHFNQSISLWKRSQKVAGSLFYSIVVCINILYMILLRASVQFAILDQLVDIGTVVVEYGDATPRSNCYPSEPKTLEEKP
jgi:hypothetical protein